MNAWLVDAKSSVSVHSLPAWNFLPGSKSFSDALSTPFSSLLFKSHPNPLLLTFTYSSYMCCHSSNTVLSLFLLSTFAHRGPGMTPRNHLPRKPLFKFLSLNSILDTPVPQIFPVPLNHLCFCFPWNFSLFLICLLIDLVMFL